MNLEKAREFFSSYYEETLEGGLRASFEQRLRSDTQLMSEYKAFERTMEELSSLKFEDIPVPIYLNARIHSRLNDSVKPAQRTRGLVFYLPRFAIAAAAAIAIGASVVGIGRFSPSKYSSADAFSGLTEHTSWPAESITVGVSGDHAVFHYTSASARVVKILDANGAALREFDLNAGQNVSADLTNPNPSATIFEIQVSDGGPDELIAIPGHQGGAEAKAGTGKVIDFMQALADRYKTPVMAPVGTEAKGLSWTLTQADVKSAADQALEGTSLAESVTASGVLSISPR